MPLEGSNQQNDGAWQQLLRDGLPASGLQLHSRPMLEHDPEDARFNPVTGSLSCNLCIAVSEL